MRVILADDSLLIREGVARLLEGLGHHVLAQVDRPELLLTEVARHRPDIVLIDIKMPPTYTDEGLRAAAVVRRQHESVGVLVISQYVVAGYATDLLEQAPTRVGYLLKRPASRCLHPRRRPTAHLRRRNRHRPRARPGPAALRQSSRPTRRSQRPRTRGPRPHGTRPVRPRDRPTTRHLPQHRRNTHPTDLHQTRSARHR